MQNHYEKSHDIFQEMQGALVMQEYKIFVENTLWVAYKE
jgi:hypothetical protein